MDKKHPVVYFDHFASTPIDPRVLEVLTDSLVREFANADSSTHEYGLSANRSVQSARSQVCRLLNAPASTVFFFSSATEANNTVIQGIVAACSGTQHLVVSATEHVSVFQPVERLKNDGHTLTVIPCDADGKILTHLTPDFLRPETVLVSVSLANSEVGTLCDVRELALECRARGILFHTDATAVAGKYRIDVSSVPIDLLTFTSHKIYGPKGVGALYVRNADVARRIRPLLLGGGQERGLRSGTLPVPLIIGFAKACELCEYVMDDDCLRIGEMRDRLWQRIRSEVPDVILNGHPTERLYNNLNVSFLGVPSEAFMIKLRNVVAVSAGSACTSAKAEPSHVLRAMNVGHAGLESAIRFGLGRFNTMEEVEYVADHIRDAVAELRVHFGYTPTI